MTFLVDSAGRDWVLDPEGRRLGLFGPPGTLLTWRPGQLSERGVVLLDSDSASWHLDTWTLRPVSGGPSIRLPERLIGRCRACYNVLPPQGMGRPRETCDRVCSDGYRTGSLSAVEHSG